MARVSPFRAVAGSGHQRPLRDLPSLAAKVTLDALARGGYAMNVMDATIAGAVLPGICKPQLTGIGGDSLVPCSLPGSDEVLRRVARRGRNGFYTGEIAEDMMAALRAACGIHTAEDFAAARAADAEHPVAFRRGGDGSLWRKARPPRGGGRQAGLQRAQPVARGPGACCPAGPHAVPRNGPTAGCPDRPCQTHPRRGTPTRGATQGHGLYRLRSRPSAARRVHLPDARNRPERWWRRRWRA